ncbi:hypothetical protein FOB84_17965 [Gordonia bronchialis]|uniref:hypothetical protein n=1 Tax=Gordonia bronchialis TaxID=2054 RepID=UPI0011C058E7|nr:hypothetical protein [Gordonia bronchialis]MCC3323254.1 hypothetical protein [Gordonia bronchialis]QGS25734.1 hypothetical protein FOB84_17965 [Gordonia bronchialis]
MTARWEPTEDQEAAIRAAHAAGQSQNAIAKELGVKQPALSRWSKRMGLAWSGVPVGARAQHERIKAERRELASRLLADVMNLRERLWSTDDPADSRALADIANAIERLIRSHSILGELAPSGADADEAKSAILKLQDDMAAVIAAEEREQHAERVTRT